MEKETNMSTNNSLEFDNADVNIILDNARKNIEMAKNAIEDANNAINKFKDYVGESNIVASILEKISQAEKNYAEAQKAYEGAILQIGKAERAKKNINIEEAAEKASMAAKYAIKCAEEAKNQSSLALRNYYDNGIYKIFMEKEKEKEEKAKAEEARRKSIKAMKIKKAKAQKKKQIEERKRKFIKMAALLAAATAAALVVSKAGSNIKTQIDIKNASNIVEEETNAKLKKIGVDVDDDSTIEAADYNKLGKNISDQELYGYFLNLDYNETEKILQAMGYRDWGDYLVKKGYFDTYGAASFEVWLNYMEASALAEKTNKGVVK